MERVYLFSFWVISGLAAMVCLLCDFVISNKLDWSLIVGLSLGVCGLLFTVVIKAIQPLRSGLVCITVIILPFLYLLNMILQEELIFSLGGSIAVLCCLFLWGAYMVYVKFQIIYRVLSITVLLTVPLVFGILYCCKYFLSGFAIDQNSIMYHLFVMILCSSIFISVDFAKRTVRN